MQRHIVELIRELMQSQHMSIRKISAQIAKVHGGSALGYTQQINRILNDPTYDPTFSTVEKVLAALNCSPWQTIAADRAYRSEPSPLTNLEQRVDALTHEVAALKATIATLCTTIQVNKSPLQVSNSLPSPSAPIDTVTLFEEFHRSSYTNPIASTATPTE